MTNPLKISLPILCAALLAACSGGGGGGSESDFINASEDANELATRVSALPGSSFGAIPASGSASFTGFATVFIDPVFEEDSDDIILLGESSVTADFSERTLTGSVTNFQGATNLTETDGDIIDVDGDLLIGEDFSFIGIDPDDNLTNRPNDWIAGYSGDLTIDGDDYALEGTLEGQLVGTRPNPGTGQSTIRGIVGTTDDGVASVNGNVEEIQANVDLFAENG